MALTIKFIGGHVAIGHVNLRKQGNEDARVLAIDVKVEGETEAAVLNELLGAAPDDDLSGMFWSRLPGSDQNSLRTHALKTIEVANVWPDRIVRFGQHQTTADVKKVVFRPRPGHRLDLVAQVSIEAPSEQLLDYIIAKINDDVMCSIESQPELALAGGTAS